MSLRELMEYEALEQQQKDQDQLEQELDGIADRAVRLQKFQATMAELRPSKPIDFITARRRGVPEA